MKGVEDTQRPDGRHYTSTSTPIRGANAISPKVLIERVMVVVMSQ